MIMLYIRIPLFLSEPYMPLRSGQKFRISLSPPSICPPACVRPLLSNFSINISKKREAWSDQIVPIFLMLVEGDNSRLPKKKKEGWSWQRNCERWKI